MPDVNAKTPQEQLVEWLRTLGFDSGMLKPMIDGAMRCTTAEAEQLLASLKRSQESKEELLPDLVKKARELGLLD